MGELHHKAFIFLVDFDSAVFFFGSYVRTCRWSLFAWDALLTYFMLTCARRCGLPIVPTHALKPKKKQLKKMKGDAGGDAGAAVDPVGTDSTLAKARDTNSPIYGADAAELRTLVHQFVREFQTERNFESNPKFSDLFETVISSRLALSSWLEVPPPDVSLLLPHHCISARVPHAS